MMMTRSSALITPMVRGIIIGTRMGMAIRFSEEDVRAMGRTARGVRSINLKKDDDAVVGMVVYGKTSHTS